MFSGLRHPRSSPRAHARPSADDLTRVVGAVRLSLSLSFCCLRLLPSSLLPHNNGRRRGCAGETADDGVSGGELPNGRSRRELWFRCRRPRCCFCNELPPRGRSCRDPQSRTALIVREVEFVLPAASLTCDLAQEVLTCDLACAPGLLTPNSNNGNGGKETSQVQQQQQHLQWARSSSYKAPASL